ncbi:MAG: metal-transporting ATPase, partial [Spirochaetia bacterium]|nr:metal-transporting ATPase [Spirochaetia bacterium]
NQSGYIRCQATRVGEDTTLSQIIKMVSDAAATKAPIARIADKASGIFVPAVIVIAALVTGGWVLAGQSLSFALARGISVLVISCPCALGLATPVAIMVGNGLGARNGILFKTSEALETAGRVQIVALDKTGTITRGEPVVTDICPAVGVSEDELLEKAYALEAKSEHPLAKAIVAAAGAQGAALPEVTGFSALSGSGVTAVVANRAMHGGSSAFIATLAPVDKALVEQAEALAQAGKTPLFFEEEGKLLGIIAVADVIKSDSPEAIAQMRDMGLKVVMLTGDNEKTAKAIGAQVGVDDVIAGVLPEGKEKAIRTLQENGKVAMVGDGINDAPALTRADIGIAIGAGADVAVDSADIVLMNSTLADVAKAISLSRRTLRNIHENLFWAFFYNLICIPLAAGLFGWKMNPMVGAAAMSLSSFTVCMNALRLNLTGVAKENKNRSRDMKKTVKIEGMMCPHCEANVKKTLEALGNVTGAEVSHKAGTAVLSLSGDVDDAVIKKAVEDKGYKVVSIQ